MPDPRWELIKDTAELFDGDTVRLVGTTTEFAVRVDEERAGSPLRIKTDYHGDSTSNVFYDRAVRELVSLQMLEKLMHLQPGQVWAHYTPRNGYELYWLVNNEGHAIRLNKLAASVHRNPERLAVIPGDARLVLSVTPEGL